MKHLAIRIGLAALVVLGAMTTVARADDPILLRISNQLPSTAALSKGLEEWKSKVEVASGGKLKVEIYSNSQLYKDNEVYPAVQSRTIDMGLVVSAQFSAYDPTFEIFDLPTLFRSYEHVDAALHGQLGSILTDHLHKLGVHPLYWPQQGFSAVASHRPIQTPADFKRLKLRAHSVELARMFQLLGASPTVIAPSEVTTAMSRGTIDGLSTSLSSYFARKWFESAPNLNNTRFGVIGTVIIINKPLWDGLPPETRTMLEKVSAEVERLSTQAIIDEEDGLLKELAGKGVRISQFDAEGLKQLANLTQPMIADYVAKTGPEGQSLLNAVAALAH